MTDNAGGGMLDRIAETGHHFFAAHAQSVMHAGNDKVEAFKQFVVIVQAAIAQDIGFDAFENAKILIGELLVELVDLFPLAFYLIRFKSAGVGRCLGMISQPEILISMLYAGLSHFFDRIFAVSPFAVGMDYPEDVFLFHMFVLLIHFIHFI